MTTEEIKTEWEKRCDYIKSSKNVNTDEIYNFFIEKIEQLQFELKAADSVNEQLQAKIDELDKSSKYCNCSEPKIYRKWGEIGCDKCNKLINPVKTN